MKTARLIVIGMIFLLAGTLQAQVSVNVNIGAPPAWGPAGYSDCRYYYLPDVEAYYDVPSSRFIYYEGNTWVHRTYLPERYRSYDLYGGYKVPMTDYRGNTPYAHFREYRHQYARGYRGHEQRNIGERPGRGNYDYGYAREENRGNHGNGRGNGKNYDYDNGYGNGNGHGNGHGRGNGNGHGNGNAYGHGNGNGNGHGHGHGRGGDRDDDEH